MAKPSQSWDRLADGVKVAVGVLGVSKLSPYITTLVPNRAVSYLIALIITTLLVNLVSARVFARPTLRATWYNRIGDEGKAVPAPVIEWPRDVRIKKFEVHLAFDGQSTVGRAYVSRRLRERPFVRISAGEGAVLEPLIEAHQPGTSARIVDNVVECSLSKNAEGTFASWVTFTLEVQGDRPAVSQKRPVTVKLSTSAARTSKWVKVDTDVTLVTLS